MARPVTPKPPSGYQIDPNTLVCQTTVVTAPQVAGGVPQTVTVYCDLGVNHEGPHSQAGLPLSQPKSIYNNK